ncbi:MAG: hypothetical protein ACTSPV_06160 [Candidatus Hodarchaeales archaeon]
MADRIDISKCNKRKLMNNGMLDKISKTVQIINKPTLELPLATLCSSFAIVIKPLEIFLFD